PRVALLRELHGRLDESAEAWRLAAEDAAPRSQGRAWALASLANVALRKGQLADAEAGYRAALAEQTWYAVAHVGLARCFVAKGELALAAATLEPLVATNGDLALMGLLGDVYTALGKAELADQTWRRGLDAEAFGASRGLPDRKALAVFLADHDREL